jgi:hypothetical protein
MIDEIQQQAAGPVELDSSTFTPIDAGRPANTVASNLRQSIAYGVQQNPDEHAKLLKQQQLTGMTPEAAAPFVQQTQQAIDVESLNTEQMVSSHPRTAAWATNPDNAAVSGAEDLHRLTRIEQHAATMRAYTPSWQDKISDAAQNAYEFLGGSGSLKQRVFDYPLVRMGVGALRGTEELAGNAASFAGLHGNNPEGLNFLQRSARSLEPFNFGEDETGLDKLAANIGPMVPAVIASGGTSLLARTLGLSDKAAKVLAGLSVGGMFTADQGGKTFNTMKDQGASDYDARLAANRVAAITAPANALFGATDLVPLLRDNPLLTSIGLGGATGASGQFAQNVVTGRPKTEGLASAAIEGAAVQGGMHLGMGFMESMGEAVNEVEASKLRLRSQEKFEEAVGQIFQGDESLRIPAQEFVNYFVDKDMDPAEMANRVGVKNLTEAAAAGSDLEIPKENYFAKLDPEHQRGLLQDVVDPSTNMTTRQAAEGRQELDEWISGGGVEKLQGDFAAADAETQATPEWQKVYGDLKQRYVDAGESETAADSYAQLQANAISNLAKRAGLKADELLALHNPKVVAGEDAPGAQVLNQSVFHGSPYEFDQFDLGSIGSGEGAQAYGWGLYFAGNKDIADGYRQRLAGRVLLDDERYDLHQGRMDGAETMMAHMFQNRKVAGLSDEVARKQTAQWAKEHPQIKDRYTAKEIGKFLKRLSTGEGQLYEADIPEDHEMLHWDQSFGNQPEGIKKSLQDLVKRFADDGNDTRGEEFADGLKQLIDDNAPGQDIYNFLATDGARSAGWTAAEEASRYLNDVGISGIKYPDANSRGGEADSHNYVVFDDNAIQVLKTYYQDAESEGKRGWFRVLPDGRYEIGKTKLGDFSTFIHEPAHAYLELFRELTQRDGASDELKKDFAKIAEWLGTTPEDAYKNGFTREQHEQWARANEQYVREGKAPTSGLQRAFQNFSVWLQSIYRRASALGVEMTSDIRGVMDRLYAGDSAVDRAETEAGHQQLFETPEEAGWTEQEFRNYARGRGVEEAEARKLILSEMKEAAQRERTETWREEKSTVRDAVTAQVDARPEYRAIRALRSGKLEDGTDISLNRDLLVKQLGEERVKALQQLHRGLYRNEGGTDAETTAELLGFGSGEEMVRSLEAAPRRAQAIEQAVRATMTTRHGDIRYDGSLDDKARLAVENQERAKNIHTELAALRRRVATLEQRAADSKAAMRAITIEPLEHYQEAARQMIDDKAIADLQPSRYLNASRKFSREAFDALRKGNVKAAADAKNKELLNHFLFREASAARDYAAKFESYVKRVQSRGIQQRLGLADQNAIQAGRVGDYRDQFNWLMARYRLGPAPQAPERSLRDWADDVYGAGNEVAIDPQIFNEQRFVDYRNAPLSEVKALHEALVNVRHLALREFQMYVQGKKIAFAEAKQAMIEAARANLKSKPERIFEENRASFEKMAERIDYVDSRLIRPERLMEWLDGGKTGPWHDNLWNLASDAQGDQYRLEENVTRVVTDALEDMPAEMRRRLWTEKVTVAGIGEPMTRRRMLSIAFNMGNEGNLDRLRKTFDAFGWDRGAIEKIGGMLTREEWGFVQKAWESLKPMGVRMQELERRLTGLPPAMVKVTPFKVALDDGTEMDLEGGYFPIAMDPRFSERAIQQDAQQTAQNAMQSGYVRATTAKGYTKERTGFGGPLLLDYEHVLTSHVAKVAKDLSHREFMLASQRFLLDTEVRKTLRETLGPAYEKQFMPWLRTIINDNNGSIQEGTDTFKDWLQKARGNIVSASLGFNASTSLLQISHAPRMLLYAKSGSLAQAFVELLAHPIESSREVKELSPSEMRFRGDNLDRDIRAALQEPSYRSGYSRKVAVAAKFALELMDHLLSHTLWKAAYRDALEKYSDLPADDAQYKAAHEADSAVRLGLGTSAPKDLPAIMRSNEFNKFITTLYGFHNGVYNQLRDIGHQFRYDRKFGKATVASLLTVLAPAVLGNMLTGRGPGTDKKNKHENAGEWAAKKSLAFMADTVPLLRSAVSFMETGRDVQFSPIENVLQKGAKAAMDATSSKAHKDWLGIGLNAAESLGEAFGVPGSHQAVKTLRYVERWKKGKLRNPNVWNAVVGGGR